jgi:cytochrome c553
MAAAVSGMVYFPGPARGEDNSYVGSKSCGMCHSDVAKQWNGHTHARALRAVQNGQAPDAGVQAPEGKGWSDLSWVIGGEKYARFTDSKGFLVTGPKAQWSAAGKTLTPFMANSAPGTAKFSDIRNYVVGWKESGTYEDGVQNKLEGIPGVWFESGVGCEACHGMGAQHVDLKDKEKVKQAKGDLKIVRDKSMALCGTCHKRNDGNSLSLASKDMVEGRQQFTEMSLNKKGKFKFTCVMCHDPHVTSASAEGIPRKCESCHTGKFARPVKIAAMQSLACIDCHMPYSDRVAWDAMDKGYHRGDTRSHLFGISANPAYTLDSGGGKAALNSDGFARLTVEMTCYSCHKTGKATDLTREKLLEMMKQVHGAS